ncbi:MAG: hypothetical protein GJU77_04395 [Ferrovum sp.]|jgi:hypothetical protein|nr:hypothetical protein [Ferrovum sp.]
MKARISIFGVQPLTYSDDVRERLFIEFISYKPCAPQDSPDWNIELEKLYQNGHYYSIILERNESISLPDVCDFTFTAYLFCNTRLNIFTIVFELRSNNSVETTLDTNKARQMLVSSDDDQRLSVVKSATEMACEIVAKMVSIDHDDVAIKNDTCNVTIFICQDNKELPVKAETCYSFISSDDVERMTVCREALEISERTIILFGGRVHLVASVSDNDIYIIKNILLNLQFMWFFVPIYLKIASILHLNIVSGNADYSVDELEEKSVNLSNIAQTIKLQNESEKLSYETLTKKFYERIEGSWGIEKSIAQLENYASFFEGFIKNTREKQARKADEILNYVLAALAIFGVVGFWADILHAELVTRDWRTFGRFEHSATNSLFGFTTIIFVFIGVVVAVLLIYYSIRLKHGKRKGGAH